MSQDNCCICLTSLTEGGDSVRLLCGHDSFHLRCIRQLYRANKNKYSEFFEPLYPECPLCRYRFHARDLPGYRGVKEPTASPSVLTPLQRRMIAEPAHSALPSGSRPVRLSRNLQLVERGERESALDRLMAQREALLRRASERILVRLEENPYTSARQPIELIEISSSSSISSKRSAIRFRTPSPPLYKPLSQDDPFRLPTPNYSVQLPPSPTQSRRPSSDTQRSRSPVSPLASQNEPTASQSSSSSVRFEIQDVNMQISIIRSQLERIGERTEPSTAPIDYADDSGGEEEEVETEIDRPVKIEGHSGKGRNISYIVRWNSGRATLNRCSEVERQAMPLLELYRASLNRMYVAKHRDKKKKEREV